jgi:hypothetical protein
MVLPQRPVSLMMQVVADLFFLHERGLWTGIYL